VIVIAQICSRCISDDSIPGISFDSRGVCNYCKIHDNFDKEYPTGDQGQKILQEIANKIKYQGRNKKYDCIIGVSGGCDSSFTLYLAKKLGLRPLAVHFDNTWNSNIATQNIHKVLKKLDVELYTYVVNNEEYDDIYRSFLKAGVKDIDIPTDIGLATTLHKAAETYEIKYILDGHSFRTEGIVPTDFVYMDAKYIESVQNKFGTRKLETFPNLWMKDQLKWMLFLRIKRIRPLYYIDYQKEEAKKMLSLEFGWQWYGGHHMENRFTIFAVNYFYPKRFNVDFRKIEFSGLIRSEQMNREIALEEIQKPPTIDNEIIQLVKKRLRLTDEEFDTIMNQPKKTYRDYKTYKHTFERFWWFFWSMYKMNLVSKSFYMKYTKKD